MKNNNEMAKKCSLLVMPYPEAQDAYTAHDRLGLKYHQCGTGLNENDMKEILEMSRRFLDMANLYMFDAPDGGTPDVNIVAVMYMADWFEKIRDEDEGHTSSGCAIKGDTIYLSPSHVFEEMIRDPDKARFKRGDKIIGYDGEYLKRRISSDLADEVLRFFDRPSVEIMLEWVNG